MSGNDGRLAVLSDVHGNAWALEAVLAGRAAAKTSSRPTGRAIPRASRFRGDPSLHNPEDLFVAAIAACHMLSYLALCARRGVEVLGYVDEGSGEMELDADGAGRFTIVVLHPTVTIAAGADPNLAESLYAAAHEQCFIANSCAVPIHCRPEVLVAAVSAPEDT